MELSEVNKYGVVACGGLVEVERCKMDSGSVEYYFAALRYKCVD
jgi:hypothetical protein